ncbi:MAG: site-2 protease family protein [Candidatus Polarisedimenticolia bacterium]
MSQLKMNPLTSWQVAKHLGLLAASFYTMTLAGALAATGETSMVLLVDPGYLSLGLSYSLCLIAILGAHEMGHYIACLLYRVDASPPYFLPAPPPFLMGTFGAFIRIRAPIPDRRALFDIGVAGPLAGFIVAIPVLAYGLWAPTLVTTGRGEGGEVGLPLLITWMLPVFSSAPEDNMLLCGPLMAGWVGCLATAVNLFPVGQLDGGHICYAISPRVHRLASRILVGGFVVLGLLVFPGWLFFALLLVVFGPRHPPVSDSSPPLSRGRVAIAVLAMIVLVLCFIPRPFDLDF